MKNLDTNAIRRSRQARLRKLFDDFPATYDVFKEMENLKAWEESENITRDEIKGIERKRINKIFSLGGNSEFLFNSTISLLYDFYIFKLSSSSPIETLKKNRMRYRKIPCKILVEPKFIQSEEVESIRKNLTYLVLYAEMRTLLSIIDIGLTINPKLLISKGGFANEIFANDDYFLKAIKADPILNTTIWAFLKTKFQMTLWKSENHKKYKKSLGELPEQDVDNFRSARRALFFIAVFEPECLSLNITDIRSILVKSKIISSNYNISNLKKIKHLIKNDIISVGK